MGVKTNPSKLWYRSSEYNRREQLAQFVTYVQTIKPWHLFVDRKDLHCSVIAQVMQWSEGRWNTEVIKDRSQEPGYLFCCPQAHVFMFVCLFFSCYWEEKDPQKADCAECISEGDRKWRGERGTKSWEDWSKHKGWGGTFWPGWVKECWSSACATPESFPKLVALTERRRGDHPASGAGVNFYTRDPENTSHCLTWTVSKRYKFGISSLGDWLSNVHTPPAFESSIHREGMGQDRRIGWGRTFLSTAVSAGTKQHDLWKAVIFREELFLGCLSGL